eukprot:712495_1
MENMEGQVIDRKHSSNYQDNVIKQEFGATPQFPPEIDRETTNNGAIVNRMNRSNTHLPAPPPLPTIALINDQEGIRLPIMLPITNDVSNHDLIFGENFK